MGVGGQVIDQLHLVGFALLLHELDSLFPGQLEPLQLQLLLADLAHLALNLLHDLRSKGEGRVHIIVEALVDGGADGQLHLGIQALDGLGQHVGAGVPIGFPVGLVFKGILLVFLAHGECSFPMVGVKKKRFTPESHSGVKRYAPRFHPACAPCGAPLVSSVTGGPVPAYISVGGSKAVAGSGWGKSRLQPMAASLFCLPRTASFSMPFFKFEDTISLWCFSVKGTSRL